MTNTRDISKFGYREKEMASKLLALEDTQDFLGDGVTIEFNPNSGFVFLVDENYMVGVLNDDETAVVEFISCGTCDYEGTKSDYEFDKSNNNTQECCKERFEGE